MGNTVIDALLATAGKEIPFVDPALERLASSARPILLVTAHRRENWGTPCAVWDAPLPASYATSRTR